LEKFYPWPYNPDRIVLRKSFRLQMVIRHSWN
jgi:hypothetical protein